MSILIADEKKKAELRRQFFAENPALRVYGLAEKALRIFRWVAPLLYAVRWYRERVFFGGAIESYHWIALGVNAVILFLALSFGLWLLPRMKRLVDARGFCWINREETLELVSEDHLVYSYRNENGEKVQEDICIHEYGFFDNGQRLAVNGPVTRTITDSKGNSRRGRSASSITFYDYFIPGLRELL